MPRTKVQIKSLNIEFTYPSLSHSFNATVDLPPFLPFEIHGQLRGLELSELDALVAKLTQRIEEDFNEGFRK